MDTPFFLALPRLHAEFLPKSQGCRTLWPGLPGRPESAWCPGMPWSEPMAAACLADYERACRDGASGTPVLTMGAEHAPADLSEAERRALREMAGMPAEEPEQPLRQNAQQVLLLLWLQEKQALELASLEQKISNSRRSLSGLISGEPRAGVAFALPGENELPDWKKALAAALAFVPDLPDSAAVIITSKAMADAVSELGAPEGENAPDGYHAVRVTVSDLAGLCGRIPHDRLKRGLPREQWQRSLTLCLPDISD